MNEKLSHERLLQVLDYSPETGEFTWRQYMNRSAKKGDTAGCDDGYGYIVISIDGTLYRGHRLAWFHVHGKWPAVQIDHENRVRSDNRIKNLREATSVQNNQNVGIKSNNTSGYVGVSLHKPSGLWIAEICSNKKRTYLGYFKHAADAGAAYAEAKKVLHTFQPTVRFVEQP